MFLEIRVILGRMEGWGSRPRHARVLRGCAGRRLAVAGSPLGALRRRRAGPGRGGPRHHQGWGDEGVHCVSVPGQKAPGRGHGPAGLSAGLALAPDARHYDDHERGDDDDQDDDEHGRFLPAASGWLAAVGGWSLVPALNLHQKYKTSNSFLETRLADKRRRTGVCWPARPGPALRLARGGPPGRPGTPRPRPPQALVEPPGRCPRR